MSMLLTADQQLAQERGAPQPVAIDRENVFPRDLYHGMAPVGPFGLNLPEEYGGAGAEEVTWSLALEELARASGAMASAALLAKLQAELILRVGSEAQRQRYVPDIIAGRRICLIAVTEPGAGSDVARIKTRARRHGDGREIKGPKDFITAGAVGDLAIVLARTDPATGHRGFSTLLVDKSPDGSNPGLGFVVDHKDECMGCGDSRPRESQCCAHESPRQPTRTYE